MFTLILIALLVLPLTVFVIRAMRGEQVNYAVQEFRRVYYQTVSKLEADHEFNVTRQARHREKCWQMVENSWPNHKLTVYKVDHMERLKSLKQKLNSCVNPMLKYDARDLGKTLAAERLMREVEKCEVVVNDAQHVSLVALGKAHADEVDHACPSSRGWC